MNAGYFVTSPVKALKGLHGHGESSHSVYFTSYRVFVHIIAVFEALFFCENAWHVMV